MRKKASRKAFSLLHEEVRRALSDQGFKKPTEVQEVAIPSILEGKHLLLIAPTGIGKTEAALLPLFDRWLRERPKGISLLYITPLRALNRDLMERLEWWGERLGIRIGVRHGDTSSHHRRRQALSPPDLLITTPETLQAILPGRVMKNHLRNVRWVVIDEIHELAESKRGAQLSLGLERLALLLFRGGRKGDFQRIGLSATIGSPDAVSRFLCPRGPVGVYQIPPLKRMDLSVEKPKPKKEDRALAERLTSRLDAASRLRRIREFIETHRSALLFTNTRQMAEILASRFQVLREGERIGIHHSSLSQEVRVSMERDFKAERIKALICTSSLELGIDIGSIDLVIQYNSPRQVTRLLQRVGRSGHAVGRRSVGVVITADADDTLESLVIARRAAAGELEPIRIHEKPYDVLAHQLVGLALDWGRVSREEAFGIVKRSSVYADLDREEFEGILRQMAELRFLWVEGEHFGRTRGTLGYYYENLSTIPDERRYPVRNLVTGRRIGVLDEAFVAHSVEPGGFIIFKGSPWRVLSVEDDAISVEPIDEVSGTIPSWVGEEIPVPYGVAQEVGRIRRTARVGDLSPLDPYPAGDYTKRNALSRVWRQRRKGFPVPDEKTLLVEILEKTVVIHAPFGMRVNQTLGRVFSTLLTARLGASVSLQIDPYRIVLQTPRRIARDEMEELLNLEPEAIEPILQKSLKRTSLFQWKFLNVAKRFGAVSREASYSHLPLKKMVQAYEGSLLYREALREIYHENFDLERTREVFQRLSSGEIALRFLEEKGPTPLAEQGLGTYGEIVLPPRAERLILKALERRIGERRIELFCLHCASWSDSYRVKNLPEDLSCGRCGARYLAVLKRRYRETKRLYRRYRERKALTEGERREVYRLQTSAHLYLSYGKRAVLALAGRGIGPEGAKRVLQKGGDDGERLYREVLRAERNYTRTKRFW
jgi:ATP-dependent Lhr-like helicase